MLPEQKTSKNSVPGLESEKVENHCCRGPQSVTQTFVAILNSDFNAFESENFCLRVRLSFKGHCLSNPFTVQNQ